MTDSDSVERAADPRLRSRYRPASNAEWWRGPWGLGILRIQRHHLIRVRSLRRARGGWRRRTRRPDRQYLAGHLDRRGPPGRGDCPITGQRADASGHRKRSSAIWSALVIAVMLGMFGVKDDPS